MMDTMSKSGKGRGNTEVLELICKHECKQHYSFHQQAGWINHFLPVCSCKENMYFQIPKYIDKSQYERYMLLATTEKNQVIFTREEFGEE